MASPFAPSTSQPGVGLIYVSESPPVLRTLSYQYPLKLIAPSSLPLPQSPPQHSQTTPAQTPIHTVFLLTYGGGLVAGDTINLSVHLEPHTRLILLTQGSTKIFKSPSRDLVSLQTTRVRIQPGAALCYLADPVQPFDHSAFEQTQVYELVEPATAAGAQGSGASVPRGSMCVCDWVSEGRTARGEKWGFWRDNMILDAASPVGGALGLSGRMDELGVFGTLILRGPVFERLGEYFLSEFGKLPRLGSRQWDPVSEDTLDEVERKRQARQKQETADRLIWTVASVRGFVMVKFGAREVEGAKTWLRWMLKEEGTIEREFGERALLCLK